MQIAANRNFALMGLPSHKRWCSVLPSFSRQGALYQQIALQLIKATSTKEALYNLGDELRVIADLAYQHRRMEVVGGIGQLLENLPVSLTFRSIGQYYRALAIKKQGLVNEARALLEGVADEGPLQFRARAIMSLGTTFFETGDFHVAMPFYIEAGKAANHLTRYDPIISIVLQQATPILKSLDGNHQEALSDLQRMLPAVRTIASGYSFFWYQHLNSLAIELAAVGQIEEARRTCSIVLASPYAKAYPEWHETGREIALRGYRSPRSVVSVSHHKTVNQDNVLRLRVREQNDHRFVANAAVVPAHPPARILNYVEFIRKMAKKKPRKASQPSPAEKTAVSGKTERELFFELMELLSQRQFDAEQLSTLLEFAERISSPPDAECPNE